MKLRLLPNTITDAIIVAKNNTKNRIIKEFRTKEYVYANFTGSSFDVIKKIRSKFYLADEIVTPDLLKMYCLDLFYHILYIYDLNSVSHEELFAIDALREYVEGTNNDKYNDPKTIDTSWSFNTYGIMFNVIKYLRRFNTEGYAKSKNLLDLLKAAHYLLFLIEHLDSFDESKSIRLKEILSSYNGE